MLGQAYWKSIFPSILNQHYVFSFTFEKELMVVIWLTKFKSWSSFKKDSGKRALQEDSKALL